MPSKPSKSLESFPNPSPRRDYLIRMQIPEFTCLCPKTGQPDFATLVLDYVPDRRCVELKSLKLYVWSFRNEGAFHEAVTNRMLDDLVRATQPRYLPLEAPFNLRRGTHPRALPAHPPTGCRHAAAPHQRLPGSALRVCPDSRGSHARGEGRFSESVLSNLRGRSAARRRHAGFPQRRPALRFTGLDGRASRLHLLAVEPERPGHAVAGMGNAVPPV